MPKQSRESLFMNCLLCNSWRLMTVRRSQLLLMESLNGSGHHTVTCLFTLALTLSSLKRNVQRKTCLTQELVSWRFHPDKKLEPQTLKALNLLKCTCTHKDITSHLQTTWQRRNQKSGLLSFLTLAVEIWSPTNRFRLKEMCLSSQVFIGSRIIARWLFILYARRKPSQESKNTPEIPSAMESTYMRWSTTNNLALLSNSSDTIQLKKFWI